MTHRRLLAVLGLVVLSRLALPVDAGAQSAKPRKQPTTGKMAIGDGTGAVEQPNAHMTQNLGATRKAQRNLDAQRNLQATPQVRVQHGPRPRRATTRPAARSDESPR